MTTYSHSRLSTFEHCPRQFQYRYLQKLTGEGEGIEAFLGKRVHEVLERLYLHVEKHGSPPTLYQVLKRFRDDWHAAWHENIRIVKKDRTEDSYVQQGERCLYNYYMSNCPFNDGTLATEHELTFQIGPYPFRGVIDRLDFDGTYRIVDYKTSGRLPTQKQIDQDRQLALYQIGLEQTEAAENDVELVWHYLNFNVTLRSTRTVAQLVNLESRTVALIDEIESTTEFPTRPSQLCHWCDYKDICPDGPT